MIIASYPMTCPDCQQRFRPTALGQTRCWPCTDRRIDIDRRKFAETIKHMESVHSLFLRSLPADLAFIHQDMT